MLLLHLLFLTENYKSTSLLVYLSNEYSVIKIKYACYVHIYICLLMTQEVLRKLLTFNQRQGYSLYKIFIIKTFLNGLKKVLRHC